MLNYHHLRDFLAVAKAGTLTWASADLGRKPRTHTSEAFLGGIPRRHTSHANLARTARRHTSDTYLGR